MNNARRFVVLIAVAVSFIFCPFAGAVDANQESPLTIEKQGSFFIGGKDITSDNLSLLPRYAQNGRGTISVEQMYVRYQVPLDAAQSALVLIHGCCLSGKSWETTPDGRMGWDELFVRRGYPTYVVDQVSRGRSPADTSQIVKVKAGRAVAQDLPQVFSAARESAWTLFRFGPEYPKVYNGMQFPLETQEEFWKQMVPDWFNALPTPNPTVPALSKLADKLNNAILVGHSQSGIYPFQVAKMNRKKVSGIISIEPGACPSSSEDMTPYAGMPILIVWGDNTEKSPLWAPRPKKCAEFVSAANKAGAKAEMIMLNDVGMPGASHMLMQDKHSIQIGNWIANWIDQRITKK